MSQASIDFLNVFVRYPGEELYFAMVIALNFACWFMAFGQRLRQPDDQIVGRYANALMGIVFIWLLLVIGGVIVRTTDQSAESILPPLERFATAMSIVALSWAILTPDNDAEGDRLTTRILGVFAIICVLQYVFSAIGWADLVGREDFNLSIYGVTWMFVTLTIIGFSIVRLFSQLGSIIDSPLKIVFYTILLVGFSVTLILILQGDIIGDYAGSARLTFIFAMLIMPILIYRMVVNRLQVVLVDVEQKSTQKIQEIQRQVNLQAQQSVAKPASPVERESVQLLRALGLILEDATTTSLPNKIINALVEVLKFDVVALLRLQDANYADFSIVYDNVMNRSITGIALNLDHQPTLANAIEQRSQRYLSLADNNEEITDLYSRLDIEQKGPVYFQPLVHDKTIVGVLVAANPYAGRRLMAVEEDLLTGISVIAGGLLALSDAADEAQILAEERAIQAMIKGVQENEQELAATREAQDNQRLQEAKSENEILNQQIAQLETELANARGQVLTEIEDSQDLSMSQKFIALSHEQERLRDERDDLSARLLEAEAALTSATTSDRDAILNNMLEAFEAEKADLTSERDRLQQQLSELRAGANPQNTRDLIQKMASEKTRLRDERDQLKGKLSDIASQLEGLGIEVDATGFAQLIRQLSEQRAQLQTQNTKLKQDRERLLNERARLEQAIMMEEARVMRIQMLETEVKNLAGDREALTKQRDKLQSHLKEFQEKQDAMKAHREKLSSQTSNYELELRDAQEKLTKLNNEMAQFANERSDLMQERDRLLAENQAIQTERNQLLARVEGDRDRVQEVGESGVGSLTQMIEELTSERNQLERELTETRNNLSTLENQLETLNLKAASGIPNGAKYRPDNPELLLSLVQELRTPLTSIIGYVDLLMGESAGILGAAQRNFLQRVSSNITRLSFMLDELVHLTELDAGQYNFKPASIDILALLEDAITNSSTQFREKGLEMHFNFNHELPHINGDKDALNQVIGQLLTNAYLVSPPKTDVYIEAQLRKAVLGDDDSAKPIDCIFVSFEDRGGGIQPEDEARVFARKYKAENPLIQGLGDTGVGMAVAKVLVEAHGGRLWMESRLNVGTIFHFVLPLNTEFQAEG